MFGKGFVSLLAFAGLATQAFAAPTLKVAHADAAGAIADKYIVVFKDSVSAEDVDAHTSKISSMHSNIARDLQGAQAHGLQRKYHFKSTGFKGYAGGFDKTTLAEILKSPEVAYIEQDQTASIVTTQTGSTWGLDRVSHVNFAAPYTYDYSGTGSGVTAYVIDTGIRITHTEFGGRAKFLYNAVGDGINTDANGHGTHCASVLGGKTFGVAKNVQLAAVKVLDANGQGAWSAIIDGMNYVANNAVPTKSVASMSLGGGYSAAVNSAANALVNAGVFLSVAAGNSADNAANYSPASAANAICVGAIDVNNQRASFSNYGPNLDVFAPGVSVLGAWNDSDTATKLESGTSMACPHVAGMASYFIGNKGSATPASIGQQIINTAITGQVVNPGSGSPNRIVYNGYA